MKPKAKLEFSSALPLYFQLKELLKKQIQDKTWKPEAKIPPEAELAVEYDVSVGTVKKALSDMVKDGLLYRKQGKGTFVCRSSLDSSLFWSFKRTCDLQGYPLRLISEIDEKIEVEASREVQTSLELEAGLQCHQLSGKRLYGDSAVLLETLYLPTDLFPDFDTHDLSEAVVSEILEADYNYPFLKAKEIFKVVQAKKELREELNLKTGSALVELHRITYSYDDKPIEYRIFYGDAADFEFEQQIK